MPLKGAWTISTWPMFLNSYVEKDEVFPLLLLLDAQEPRLGFDIARLITPCLLFASKRRHQQERGAASPQERSYQIGTIHLVLPTA